MIVKTIAACANSQGGTLLIGVSDSREILGLESSRVSPMVS
ncbi:ATP-binding protein [Phyllobacterium salinisoli]|nr:ATP-binding protein [Phyllobacterium salinisoli]